mmetsp:Transcript_92424/g.128293  ORF Transcript_92424/g.128293 Transcript_92424/m.128293 type:complete len:218 (+) Transcript_92424:1194-1847(+)
MELHKLQVLHRQTRTRSHGTAVASAGVCRRTRLIGAPEATRRDDGRVRPEAMNGAVLHAHCKAAETLAIITHDQIHGKVLDKEQAVELQGHAVQRMQNGMAGSVSCRGTSVSLPALPELQALSTKGSLVDLAFWGAGEGQTKGLKLQNHFGSKSAHVLDGVLIAEPVGSLDSVIGMPAPVVLGHIGQRTIDATLRRHRVRTGWEDLGDAGCLETVSD